MLASSVFAQEFVKVDQTEAAVFYVDKASIKRQKELIEFTGKVEAENYTSLTDFVTDCTNFMVLFEKIETPDTVFTRKLKNPPIVTVDKTNPLGSAVNYACTGTLKKDKPLGTVPKAK